MQFVLAVDDFDCIGAGEPPEAWLSAAEWQHWTSLPRRRFDSSWLGGRWCAKQAVRQLPGCQELRPSEIHIESRNGLEQGVAPRVLVGGRLQAWQLSISHGKRVCAAVATENDQVRLGVDIVDMQERAHRLIRHWFTAEEQSWCENGLSPALIWGLKESLYKAVGNGAKFRPRQLGVDAWLSCEQAHRISTEVRAPKDGMVIHNDGVLWWQRHSDEVVIAVQTKHECSQADSRSADSIQQEALLR